MVSFVFLVRAKLQPRTHKVSADSVSKRVGKDGTLRQAMLRTLGGLL